MSSLPKFLLPRFNETMWSNHNFIKTLLDWIGNFTRLLPRPHQYSNCLHSILVLWLYSFDFKLLNSRHVQIQSSFLVDWYGFSLHVSFFNLLRKYEIIISFAAENSNFLRLCSICWAEWYFQKIITWFLSLYCLQKCRLLIVVLYVLFFINLPPP